MRSPHIACSLLLGFIARIAALKVATSATRLYYDYTLAHLKTFFSCLDYSLEVTCGKLLPLLMNRKHHLLVAYEQAKIDGARAEALVQHYLPMKEYWGWVFPYTLIINNRALDDLLPTDIIIPSIHAIQLLPETGPPVFSARTAQRTINTLLHAPLLAGVGIPHLLARMPETLMYWEIGSRDLKKNPLRSAIFHLLDLQLLGRRERFMEGAPKDIVKVEALLDLLNDPEKWLQAFSQLQKYLSAQLRRERLTRPRQAYWHGLLMLRAFFRLSLSVPGHLSCEGLSPEKAGHLEGLLKSYLTAYGMKNIPYWPRIGLLQLAYYHDISFDDEPAVISILDHTQRQLVTHGMIGGSFKARHMGWKMALYKERQRVIPPPTEPMDLSQFVAWWASYDVLEVDYLLINPQFPHPIRVLNMDVCTFEEFLNLANLVLFGRIVDPPDRLNHTSVIKMIVRVMVTNLLVHKTLGAPVFSFGSEVGAFNTGIGVSLHISLLMWSNALLTHEYFSLAIDPAGEPVPVVTHHLQALSQETPKEDVVRWSRLRAFGSNLIKPLLAIAAIFAARSVVNYLCQEA